MGSLKEHSDIVKNAVLKLSKIEVLFSSSPYGDECSLIDFIGEDSLAEKLQKSVRYLDQYYHDQNEIEKGTSSFYQ